MAALNTDDYSGIIQGICPTGWHVPTDSEWMELEITCGMSPSEAAWIFWRGNIAFKLMIKGPEWQDEYGSDDFGFSAKGSGWYGQYIGGIPVFTSLTYSCLWLTYDQESLMSRYMEDAAVGVYRFPTEPERALSIRCIKDQ